MGCGGVGRGRYGVAGEVGVGGGRWRIWATQWWAVGDMGPCLVGFRGYWTLMARLEGIWDTDD